MSLHLVDSCRILLVSPFALQVTCLMAFFLFQEQVKECCCSESLCYGGPSTASFFSGFFVVVSFMLYLPAVEWIII